MSHQSTAMKENKGTWNATLTQSSPTIPISAANIRDTPMGKPIK